MSCLHHKKANSTSSDGDWKWSAIFDGIANCCRRESSQTWLLIQNITLQCLKKWTQLIFSVFSCQRCTSGSTSYHLQVQHFMRWAVRKHCYENGGFGLEFGSSRASILDTHWRPSSPLMQRGSMMTFGIHQNVGSTCLAIASKNHVNAFIWQRILHQLTRIGEIFVKWWVWNDNETNDPPLSLPLAQQSNWTGAQSCYFQSPSVLLTPSWSTTNCVLQQMLCSWKHHLQTGLASNYTCNILNITQNFPIPCCITKLKHSLCLHVYERYRGFHYIEKRWSINSRHIAHKKMKCFISKSPYTTNILTCLLQYLQILPLGKFPTLKKWK